MTQFPSNSRRSRGEEPRARIVESRVTRRKPSVGRRFSSMLIGEDTDSLSGFLITDVVMPALKNLLSNMTQEIGNFASDAVERALFGTDSGSRGRVSRSAPRHTAYGSATLRRSSGPSFPERRDVSYRGRAKHDFGEIIIDSRVEAEAVLDELSDLTNDFGTATVSDLYQQVGIETSASDLRWGWHDLRSAKVVPTRGGYLLSLPSPRELD